jgi:uncharacterized protein YfaS (alpha-2-macroglobulin family)
MSKKTRSVLLVLGLVCLAALPGCSRKKNPSRVPPAPGEVKGELRVAFVTPLGQTKSLREAEEIVVIFDHPMAALEPIPLDESTSFLKFEPAFDGTYRWMGTKALSFTPKERFPFATEIKVTVPAGTRSNDGYVLKQEYSWTFATVRPGLVSQSPESGAEQQRLDQTFTMVFNQPVSESDVKNYVTFSGNGPGGEEAALPFSLSRPTAGELKEAGISHPPADVLKLRPASLLKPDFHYVIELKAGLKGREGSLGLEKPLSFDFRTFKTFAFMELEGAEGHVPNESYLFKFTNDVATKDFVAKLLFEPKVEIPSTYEEWDHGSRNLWLNLALKPETKYAAVIPADLKDEFGNALGKESRVEFTTAAFAPMVRMTTGQGVLESYAELTYPLYVVNTDQVRLQATRVSRDAVLPLIRADRAFRSSESFMPPGGYQIDKPLTFKLPRNVRQFVPLNVKELLGDKFGLLFVQLDTASDDKWSRYPKAFLQVTELGITGKFSAEADLIWVTELRTGLPVAEAEVEIRNEANTVLWSGRTDKDGKADAPGWKSLGLKAKDGWSKPEQWVFARRGADVAFASSNWGTGIDPYRFNISYDWSPEPEKFRGTIFSERGIYRAGETVHLKGIVRKNVKGQWRLPSFRDVGCEIKDPFQKSVYKGRAALDAFGSFSIDYETRPDASLGTYFLSAAVPPEAPGEKETRINESFRVEAFRPAEFELHLRALKDSFVFGDAFQAEVRGAYLYGGAMAGQKAGWTLRLNASSYMPPNHPGYAFGTEMDASNDEEGLAEKSRLLASGEAALGADGKIDVKANLIPEKESATVSASLEATVQGPNRRSVSNRIQAFVHQGEFYIGLKPGTSFLKQGETLPVQVITTAADGAVSADRKVTVKLVRREWHSTRKAGIGGRFKWHTEKVDTEVASQDVRTKAEPIEVSFKPDKAGFYLLKASAQDGRRNAVTTATDVYVTGKDYVPWQRRDDDALDLVADRDRYKPGDTARILVKSPYEKAKALVTVERESILTSRVVEIQGSASEIEIPVTSELIPNAFVSVILVQGRTKASSDATTEDIGKPSFKIGYAGLSVDPSEKRLTVDVTPDKKAYKPRDAVTINLKVKDAKGAGMPASVAVAAVDVGVLNLIGYQTPDPFSDFYGERPLSVETADTRLNVVGQRNFGEKGENAGGGGGGEAMGMAGLGQVQLRGDFKSTAFWNASVSTDANGEAVVRFTLPDNLTTFRVMAVALTKDSLFGKGSADFKVAKPLLLMPSIPRFARVGDTFQAGVVVSNFSERKGTVKIGCVVQGLKAADAAGRADRVASRDIVLGPGESREVLYAFEAERPGRANLAFRAKMDEDSDGLEIGFPVEMPRPTETVATFGEVVQEPKRETINLPDSIYPEQSRIDLQASASALTGLGGTVEYLADYPYLCLEQRVSAVLPFIVAPQVIRDFKMSPLDDRDIRKRIMETIKNIYSHQKDSGGFGLWTDSIWASPFVSAYAAFALLKARIVGYDVDAARLDNALNFLKNFVKAKPDRSLYPYDARSWTTVQAFGLYVLAYAGQPQPAYVEKLYLERDSLSLFGRACLLKAIHLGNGSPEAEAAVRTSLLNKIKITPSQAHFEEDDEAALRWIYSSHARTTAVVLQALIETGANVPVLPDVVRWLVEQGRTGRWRSTQENFYVFYALSDFYRTAENVRPDFKAEVTFAGKRLMQETFSSVTQAARASSPLSEFKIAKGLGLEFSKSGPGTFYYGARLTYAPKSVLAPRDEGFAVYKSIETQDGKPLDEIKAGAVVVVTLHVVVPKESLFVVVDDPLPAGFEAVDGTFLTESDEQQRRLAARNDADEEPWWQGFDHVEIRDNKVLLFANSLMPGIHTHRYLARALTFGRFALPGTKAEAMYEPEVFGRSVERSVKIVK